MIEIKTKIHDNFSVEFKVGFIVQNQNENSNFKISTWIFVPNSLDINPQSYGKTAFYQDVKSNVRLITPTFFLYDIASQNSIPLKKLKAAIADLIANTSQRNADNFEHHMKMYAAITKSAIRDETVHIECSNSAQDIENLCCDYIENTNNIINEFRKCKNLVDNSDLIDEHKNHATFIDEYLSHLIGLYAIRIIKKIDAFGDLVLQNIRQEFVNIRKSEENYKCANAYVTPSVGDDKNNRLLVFRHGLLKKYIESDLYIKLDKKRDGYAVEQLYYSIAAGVAMLFATVIAFVFQRKFGSISAPVFVALIVSYMLKDRIKELMRYYFAHKLGDKYFDNKARVEISNTEVGMIKEGVDFIGENKVPCEVLEIRNRSNLLQAENKIFDEKIILYRKSVSIDGKKLAELNEYPTSGIHDIFRLQLARFMQKMDNPDVPVFKVNDNGELETISTKRIYYINIVMKFEYDDLFEYKRFRLVVTRNGILEVQEMC